MLTVGVLGAVEARRDGELLPVPAGKTTELLARLAVDTGTPVRADVLLDELWTEAAGRNTLQSKVSQLRRALGDRELVASSGDAYVLAVGPDQVDASRVVELAADASGARVAGDPAVVLEKGREGLALFRGEVLVDAGEWAGPHRTRFDEIRLGLLEDVMAARVELGSGGDVVGELEALVVQHPLREGLWSSLVLALYRAGRQADALAAYARVRALLIDELGVEPGPDLRLLEQQVLRQDPGLRPATPRATGTPGNLPPDGGVLVGRTDDLATLESLVRTERLVSVVGTAGVGKTRLALEAGRAVDVGGGVWLVRLEAVDATADLVRVVAETLHVPAGEEPLRDRLAGAETLLVLDNCEHLVAGVSALANRLLELVPDLRILVTSQVPLGVDGERVLLLDPLSREDSVVLFEQRAQQTRRGFVLDDDTNRLVAEVCASLDGLPLAIELAAARVRSISVRDIARRLDDRFALLQDPSSHRPHRRRALSAAIGWSYDLLFPDDQRGLWALSCFAASASLDAVEHVMAALGVPAEAVLDTVTRLVDRSLVAVDVASDGGVRYRLLDSIRAYAEARVVEAGALDGAMVAHAVWYADLAAWCDAHVRGRDQPECLAIARAERADVDAALAWCASHDPVLGTRIANGFGWTWVVLGDGTAGAARVRAALAPDATAHDRATALLLAGWLEASAGDVALARSDLDAAARLAGDLPDKTLVADVERHRAFLAIQQGAPDRVLAAAAASLATYRPQGLAWPTAASLLLAAYGSLMLGDTATATRDATEAVGILEPVDDSWGLVHAEAMLGGIAQAEHRFGDAVVALSRAAEESQRLGFTGQAALHLAGLARARHRAGDLDGAAASFLQAVDAANAGGDGRLAATARLHLARLLRSRGEGEDAVVLLEENQRWYERAGGGEGALLTRCLLYAESGDGSALEAVLAEALAQGNDEVRVHALDALAAAAAREGDASGARCLLDEADALAPAVGHLVDEADRTDRALALAVLAEP